MSDNYEDRKAADSNLEAIHEELSTGLTRMEEWKGKQEEAFRSLREEVQKNGTDPEAIAKVGELSENYAEMTRNVQDLTKTVDYLKAEMDTPALRGGSDLADHDRKAAVELQKRAFVHKGGDPDEFMPDMDKLVVASDYRSAVRKLMKVGVENRSKVIRSFTENEKRAFDAASLDVGFFSPELLGLEVDCDPECAYLTDLYDSITVSRSSFQYLKIDDYGALGEYGCDAACDGPMGPEGNIKMLNGQVDDFRGVFCLQRKVVAEANYDLLGFMFRAIQRSHRINRNANLITGPNGWLPDNDTPCFPVKTTASDVLNAPEFRSFLLGVPWDFGEVTAVMHQNVFAYLMTMQKTDGGFVFGDGEVCMGPDSVSDCIRISNCLPDPTEGMTLTNFPAGSFIMAAAAWDAAYAAVEKRPLWIEQYEGGSTAWCVMYQFGAEDGGFQKCCNAGRILTAGAPAPAL